MSDELDAQIAAYEKILPSIKSRYGSAWVLMTDGEIVKTFPSFAAAAEYAHDHFGRKQVLIRHTDERLVEAAPFIQVHVGR